MNQISILSDRLYKFLAREISQQQRLRLLNIYLIPVNSYSACLQR